MAKESQSSTRGRKSPKLGDVVRITLLDHADQDSIYDTVLKFVCYGELVAEDDDRYILLKWGNPDDPHDANNEHFSILKSATLKVEVLR